MPPKQVYGKRTVAKPSASFAGFISPGKVVGLTEESDASKESRRTQKASKDSDAIQEKSRSESGKGRKKEVDVVDLTGDLEGLKIAGDDENQGARQSTTTAKTTRKKTSRKMPRSDTETVDLTEGFQALDINKHDAVPTTTPGARKEKIRKSKQTPMQSSPTKVFRSTTKQKQTSALEPQASQQSAPETPTRVRKLKAVVIPRSKPMAPLPTPDSTPELEDPYTSYVSPLLSLQSYGRTIIPFKQWSASLEPHFTVSKIAEASFSEVYRLSALNTACRSMKESVLKLVPLKSAPNAPLQRISQSRSARNRDDQAQKEKEAREEEDSWKSHVDDVHSEVKLLQNLNYIPGFTNFRELTVLQGRPSKNFTEAWRAWNKARPRGKKSEFPDPSKKASYDDTQLWAVIEMQDAGTDVEKVMGKGGLSTIWEIWDVFWGVCLSVAKAEEACRFEHRDLHLENICIRSSRSEAEEDLVNPIVKDPLRRKLGFTGLETTVIDYTLSRADVSFNASRRSSSISSNATIPESEPGTPTSSAAQEVAYLDLNKDECLFTGDASEEYQYEIYRYMRGAVFYNDPLKSPPEPGSPSEEDVRRSPRKTSQHIRFDDVEPATPRSSPRKREYADPPEDVWRQFHPKTNLVWAHFILYMLLEHLKGNEPSNLSSKEVMRNVKASAEEKSKVVRRALKLHKVLEKVAQLLEPGALAKNDSLGSVKELAVLAMEERWLRVEDVAGE